ncbi:M48 family metallopeptidase [Halobaculum sp. MBLA0143]|uniref:M48 family metallopeptidase n=1 Tax=Halobaculum sp. MBLA0143 TaxID=3079933 RepID=UPI0035251A7A
MRDDRADATFTTSDERRVPCVVQHGDSDDPRLRLTPDGAVRVTLPDRDAPPVDDVLEANRDWIERQYERQHERLGRVERQFGDLTTGLVVWGYTFDFETREGQYDLTVDSGRITVSAPTGRSPLAFLKNRLASRLRDTVVSMADRVAPKLDGDYETVQIRNQATKWASYSTTGTLSFNVRCGFLPLGYVRYLVAHELAHSVNTSHDAAFWSLVETVVDDPRQRSTELEGFAAALGRNEVWGEILAEW